MEEKLITLRNAVGLTQNDVAEALGLSRQAVSRWETGTVRPTVENLRALSQLYDVSLDYLLGDDPAEAQPGAETAPPPPAEPAPKNRSRQTRLTWILAILLLLSIGTSLWLYLRQGSHSDTPEIEMGRLDDTSEDDSFDIQW